MSFLYTRIHDDESGVMHLSVFVGPEYGFKSVSSEEPHFASVEDAIDDPGTTPEELFDLLNVESSVRRSVENADLSSRVSVENGQIVLDGEPLSGPLVDHILDLLAQNSGDLTPWVRFLERLDANPVAHSRQQLFTWIESLIDHDGGFTLNPSNGFIVGYKGVNSDLTSVRSGPGIVNGQAVTGHLPNDIGNVIEMKRDDVQHDPSIGCSRGLHVGTFNYAKGWSRGAIVEVLVDPADVVSVPTECSAQKMRCAKYEVVDVAEKAYGTALKPVEDFDDDFDPDYDPDFDRDDDEYWN